MTASPLPETEPVVLPCPTCESDIVVVGMLSQPTVIGGCQVCCGTCGTCGPERTGEQAARNAWNEMPRRASSPNDIGERLTRQENLDISNVEAVRDYLDRDSVLHFEAAAALTAANTRADELQAEVERVTRERDEAQKALTEYAQDWKLWAGGAHGDDYPDGVSAWEVVEYRLRNGEEATAEASAVFWHHTGDADDIVAYRRAALSPQELGGQK